MVASQQGRDHRTVNDAVVPSGISRHFDRRVAAALLICLMSLVGLMFMDDTWCSETSASQSAAMLTEKPPIIEAMAIKLFKMKRLISGIAALLVGMTRVQF